jgi:hypothetical protein
MPSFHVRFKGMLTGQERERLAVAGIELEGSEPSVIAGVETGRKIYTVTVEAESADAALAAVREALEPGSVNFSDWDVAPAP